MKKKAQEGGSFIIDCISNAVFSSLENDIRAFLDDPSLKHTDCASFINNFLRAVCKYLMPISSLTPEIEKDLYAAIQFCLNYMLDHFEDIDFQILCVEQFLYNIIQKFLKMKLIEQSLLMSNVLLIVLQKSKVSNDKKTTNAVKHNMSICLWNSAMVYEESEAKCNKYSTGLKIRSLALDFSLLLPDSLHEVCIKSTKALQRYCSNKDQVCETEIISFLKKMKNCIFAEDYIHCSEHCLRFFLTEILCKWSVVLIKHQTEEVIQELIAFLQQIGDIKCKCKSEYKELFEACSEILKFCFHFFSLQKFVIVTCKSVQIWTSLFESTSENAAPCVTDLMVNVCSVFSQLFLANMPQNLSKSDGKELKRAVDNISIFEFLAYTYLHHYPTSAKNFSDNRIHLVVGILKIFYLHAQENDSSQFTAMVPILKRFLDRIHSNWIKPENIAIFQKEMMHYYIAAVSNLGRLCFTKELYEITVFTLKISTSLRLAILKNECTGESIITDSILFKERDILAHSYLELKDYNNALLTIAMSASMEGSIKRKLFELWCKVKRKAIQNGEIEICKKIISDVLHEANITISVEQEVQLLQHELQTYKKDRYLNVEQLVVVITQILKLCNSNITKACMFIELAQLQYPLSEEVILDIPSSPMELCQEAIKMLENHLHQNPDSDEVKLKLSVAFFWMYHKKITEMVKIAKEEIDKAENESKLQNSDGDIKPIGDEEDPFEKCDIRPSFASITALIEKESLENLDKAVSLWTEVSNSTQHQWSDVMGIANDLGLLDVMRNTAEIFATSACVLSEIKTWSLHREFANACSNKLHELVALTSIILALTDLGYLNVAKYIITYVEANDFVREISDDYYMEIVQCRFFLIKSQFLFYAEKFDEGFQLLLTVLQKPILQRNSKSAIVLNIEAKLLITQYLLLPPQACNLKSSKELQYDTPLSLATECHAKCLGLIKYHCSSDGQVTSDKDWIYYQPIITRLLLKASLISGELYTEIGAPREARSYLQQSLTTAQSLILTFWSAKLLIALGHLDLICGSTVDCLVKLNGLQHMLSISKKNVVSPIASEGVHNNSIDSIEESCHEFISSRIGVTIRGRIRQKFMEKFQAAHSSPLTHRTFTKPEQIDVFSDACECGFCMLCSLHIVQLEIRLLKCMYLISEQQLTEATENINWVKRMYNKVSVKFDVENYLGSVKIILTDSSDLFIRTVPKVELRLLIQAAIQQSLLSSIAGEYFVAQSHLSDALGYLETAAKCPQFLYTNLYASLNYQKISSLVNIIMKLDKDNVSDFIPFVFHTVNCMKSEVSQAHSDILTQTPDCKNVPSIHVTDLSVYSKNKLCKAPIKKDLLSSAMKRAISISRNIEQRPSLEIPCPLNFSSSEDDSAFISPQDVLVKNELKFEELTVEEIKQSKKGNEQKKNLSSESSVVSLKDSNRTLRSKNKKKSPSPAASSKPIAYKFFPSKTEIRPFKSSGDIWSSALKDDILDIYHSPSAENKKSIKAENLSKSSTAQKLKKTRRQPKSGNSKIVKKTARKLNCDQLSSEIIHGNSKSATSFNKADLSKKNDSVDFNISKELFVSPELIESNISSEKIQKETKKTFRKFSDSSESNPSLEKTRDCSESGDDTHNNNLTRPVYALMHTPKLHQAAIEKFKLLKHSQIEKLQHLPPVSDITIEALIKKLDEIRILIQHNPPCPLYSDICKMLAVLNMLIHAINKGEDKRNILNSATLLSECYAVTFRHQALTTLTKLIKKIDIESSKTLEGAFTRLTLDDSRSGSEYLTAKLNSLYFSNLGSSAIDIKEMTDKLPAEWTVIQVTAVKEEMLGGEAIQKNLTPKLLVCRYQKDGSPIVIGIGSCTDAKFKQDFLTEFNSILEENRLTMTQKVAKVWWTVRRQLDKRMKELIESMENIWLGCWKGLFVGKICNEERLKQLKKAVQYLNQGSPVPELEHIEVLLDSASLLTSEQISAAVSQLWSISSSSDSHSKICDYVEKASSCLPSTERHPVILILDKYVQALPWESMPVFRDTPVTRIPSLKCLNLQLSLYRLPGNDVLSQGVNSQNAFYIINPDGDLAHTQKTFENALKNEYKWEGISGRPPSHTEFLTAFTDYELFLYCGHGSGKRYLSIETPDKVVCHASVILMGCSSGSLKSPSSKIEPTGVVLKYWLGGCPCIVANLWDVTDKEIDRFTDSLLESWLPSYKSTTSTKCSSSSKKSKMCLARSVTVARQACKMPYLVGAAPVIYGLPVFARA